MARNRHHPRRVNVAGRLWSARGWSSGREASIGESGMSGTAITVSPSPEVWQATDWRQLWLSISSKKQRWRSLAIVPAGPGVAPDTVLQIAVALAHTGTLHMRAPIHVANATQIGLSQLGEFSEELARYMRQAERMIVAVPAFGDNLTSLPLAKATDGALLCVVMGAMSSADARAAVAQLGASRFLGSAVFRLPAKSTGAEAASRPAHP